MIYEKTLLNTDLKYDTETEKLYRFHKKSNKWKHIYPNTHLEKGELYPRFNGVCIDKEFFKIHRLIYYVCHNDFDIFDIHNTIDHINVNHLDNRLENLRTATHQEQQNNKKYMNGELVKGFYVFKDGRKKKYAGYYYINKKRFSKGFLTEEEAIAFYNDNRERF